MEYLRYILITAIFAFIGYVIYASIHLGVFKEVTFEAYNAPELHVVFKEHVGPYNETVKTIEEVEAWVQRMGATCKKSFGQYLDDPAKMESERLRSNGGCIVEQEVANLPSEFQQAVIPARKVLRGYFQGSPAIGPLKVYAKAEKWMKENRYQMPRESLEIYEILPSKEMNTEYHFPMINQ